MPVKAKAVAFSSFFKTRVFISGCNEFTVLVPILDGGLFEALDFIIVLFDFFLIYTRFLYPDVVGNKLVAILLDVIIMFVLVIPYPIARWGIFVILFGFAFFWGFQPWTWGEQASSDYEKQGSLIQGQPYNAGDHPL